MIFAPWKDGDREKAHKFVDNQFDKMNAIKVELIDVRTNDQNRLLHGLVLPYAAIKLGESRISYVKEEYYKRQANYDIFVMEKYDKILDCYTEDIRSSAELTKADFSQSIDRFAYWCATIPAEPFVIDLDNEQWRVEAVEEIRQNKEFLYK